MKFIPFVLIATLVTAGAADPSPSAIRSRDGRTTYPPEMAGAKSETYKTVGDTKLSLYIFNPESHDRTQQRPAIVFFFGGGWTSGSPQQFEQQCRYLASRGLVAIAADYRVASRQKAKPVECVADAKSAIRWVRKHAQELGIDSNRIAAAGGSSGGHIAACTGTVPGQEEPGEDTTISSMPNAMVLFNPALVLAPLEGSDFSGVRGFERVPATRLGAEPEALSPAHHVKAGAPPTIIFHGKADTTVPIVTAEAFAAAMKKAGNRCELSAFDGQQHGFFNYGRGDDAMFRETLKLADKFLVSLGWQHGEPTVDAFFGGRK